MPKTTVHEIRIGLAGKIDDYDRDTLTDFARILADAGVGVRPVLINGQKATVIVALDGQRSFPMFVSITPDMKMTDMDGDPLSVGTAEQRRNIHKTLGQGLIDLRQDTNVPKMSGPELGAVIQELLKNGDKRHEC